MKVWGSYLPKIAGKPSGVVEDVAVPEKLYINLQRGGLTYTPVVENAQDVKFGQALAEVQVEGGKLSLPSPVSGKVFIEEKEDSPSMIVIEADETKAQEGIYDTSQLKHISREEIRNTLSSSGIWPFFWSSETGGIPSLDDERPRAIIVNFLLSEPFRARGEVILKRSWRIIMEGIKYLDRLLADYGTIEIILTAPHGPVARTIYKDLAGFACVNFHPVQPLYPVENNILLKRMLRKVSSSLKKEDNVWVIDAQGVEAVGACLSGGFPLYQRVVAVGGPGLTDPKHLSVRVGTPVKELLKNGKSNDGTYVLRGGLFLGNPVDPDRDYVNFDDDAFFFLPEVKKREFLSFLRPGFNRTSYLPAFATVLTRGDDTQVSTSLRGEIRPCVACGLCESICPAGLLPQFLHRYLFNDELDDAEKIGLNLCIGCNLCTYICPSKIELQKQFAGAKERLKAEHEEAEAILARKNTHD